MKHIPFRTVDDLITARFFLCYSQEQLAEMLGVTADYITRLEKKNAPLPRLISLGLLNVVYHDSNVTYFNELFSGISSSEYVAFLRSFSRTGKSVPSFRKLKQNCKCANSQLTYDHEVIDEKTHFFATCNECYCSYELTGMTDIRRYLIRDLKTFDPYNPLFYDITRWNASKVVI